MFDVVILHNGPNGPYTDKDKAILDIWIWSLCYLYKLLYKVAMAVSLVQNNLHDLQHRYTIFENLVKTDLDCFPKGPMKIKKVNYH